MSKKVDKLINRHLRLYELPKPIGRKIRKLKRDYKLNMTEVLYLIDSAAEKYYQQMNELSDKMEKELENEG